MRSGAPRTPQPTSDVGSNSGYGLQRAFPCSRTIVADGLDVVAVGVEEEGAVVAGVVVARAWLAVPRRPTLDSGPPERVDGGVVVGDEGQVRVLRRLGLVFYKAVEEE